MDFMVGRLEVLYKRGDGTRGTKGNAVVAPVTAASNGFGQMLSQFVISRIRELGQHRYNSMIRNDSQIFL